MWQQEHTGDWNADVVIGRITIIVTFSTMLNYIVWRGTHCILHYTSGNVWLNQAESQEVRQDFSEWSVASTGSSYALLITLSS